jgi:serine/threonine-protein kinase
MAATQAGVILGTAAYMSPEQAKGFAADQRSDVFSFGCVLYEMLTGRQPFQGETVAEVLGAVLVAQPDLNSLPPNLNPRLPELVRRCLEKNPKRRWQAVGDLRVEFEVIAAAPRAVAAPAPLAVPLPPLWKRAIPIAAMAAILATALTSVIWWTFRPSTPPATISRFSFTLPEGQAFTFTNTGRQYVAFSPDGTEIAYVANRRIYLRSISDLEPRAIPGTAIIQGVTNPVFSPDGRFMAFFSFADDTLKKIAVGGGAAVTLCPANNPYGMSWGPDGIVFGQAGTGGRGIMRVSPNGGKPELLVSVKGDELADSPQMLPGGQAVLFTLAKGAASDRWDKAQIVVQSLKSGERKILVEGGSDARYIPTSHLVYALGGTLFALPFDERRLQVTGGPAPILEGVARAAAPAANAGTAQFSVSNTGSLIYSPGPAGATVLSSGSRVLGLADRKGDLDILKLPPSSYDHPRVSPDGKRVAFGTDDGKEAIVWIYDLAGTTSMRRLTFGGRNRFPIWSADGQHVAFQSDREGDLGIFWQRADGTGAAERLTKADQGTSHVPESWAPDSKRFLFEVTKGSNVSLWAFSLDDDKKAMPFGGVQSGTPITAAFSPDGRWVVYHSDETGRDAIYVQPFPATGAKYQVPKNDPSQNDHHPVWSSDGRELFYIPAFGALAAVSVTTQPSFAFGNAVPVPRKFTGGNTNSAPSNEREYDVTPDGKIIGPTLASAQTQTGTPTAPEIRVVLNWLEELKRLVPTN